MKFLKKHFRTLLIVIILIAGLGLLAYPSFSNWWNTTIGSHTIANYTETVAQTNPEEIDRIRQEAEAYNAQLSELPDRYHPTPEQNEEYNRMLRVGGSPVMGSITIPAIKVTLPLYHGTSEQVLQSGAGHLEGSSLPIGGAGTHTVITGHRGLPSAKLFTDLDKVVAGDYIVLHVLDKTLTYKVETIRIVLPSQLDQLVIEPGKDELTLVTCTPYGINTHRILITGQRTDNLEEWSLGLEARVIDEKVVALWIGGGILLVSLTVFMIRNRKPKTRKGEPHEND